MVQNRRVLLTGGGGYIGTHIVLELLRGQHDVCVVDDFRNSFPEMLERVERLARRGFIIRAVDICDAPAINLVFAEFRPDAVIHLAGLKSVPESLADPAGYYRVNVGGAAGLLEAMERHDCRQLIFSSTAAVYGESPDRANRESDAVSPTVPYAKTKRVVEEMLEAWCAAGSHRQAISLRYFNPVGADASGEIGERAKTRHLSLVPIIIEAALGVRTHVDVFGSTYPTPDGSGMRDFIHVSDLAAAHVAALRARNTGHRIFNVGTGNGSTVLQLIDCFRSTVGVDVPYQLVDKRDGDLGVSVADPQRIAKELGWRSSLGLKEMCSSAWNWTLTLTSITEWQNDS
jgi:UDP-glucose 4-epimerase